MGEGTSGSKLHCNSCCKGVAGMPAHMGLHHPAGTQHLFHLGKEFITHSAQLGIYELLLNPVEHDTELGLR